MRDDAQVSALAGGILGTSAVTATHLPVGFGNENWRIAGPDGEYLLKIGPLDTVAKWASAHVAHERAKEVGVPVAPLVHFSVRNVGVVRIYEWVAGASPATIAGDRASCERFFTELGRAVAALHTIELERFSSRLDGSAPSFPQWSAYISYRLPQIRERCARDEALDAATVTRACDAIERELGPDLDAVVRPTLVHRDLHADNLLVDERGALVAILDWDQAEAWDPAADWFRLDFKLFPAFACGEQAFLQTYDARHPERPLFDRRVRIVDLMETLNSIAGVAANERGSAWDTELRDRLLTLTRG